VFTTLRHATQQYGAASFRVDHSVMMVHGFDVPLDRPDHLEKLIGRLRPFTDQLGLRIRIVRTNLMELWLQDWEDSFLAQLASCLHNYSHEFGYGVAGSGEPYNALVVPWGQNPCTDRLLSGSAFRVTDDGTGFSRTEKVAFIAKHTIASRVLKV